MSYPDLEKLERLSKMMHGPNGYFCLSAALQRLGLNYQTTVQILDEIGFPIDLVDKESGGEVHDLRIGEFKKKKPKNSKPDRDSSDTRDA